MANITNDLNDSVYKNLHALSKWKKPSVEFLEILKKDIFLKPNTKAFLHVTHYLCTILNEKEFRKRFCWPVYDKKSETDFKTTTKNYLNELREKFHMNYEPVKTRIVVLPGGAQFLKVYSEFSTLIMREAINKLSFDIHININVGNKHEYLHKKISDSRLLIAKSCIFNQKLIDNTVILKKATAKINKVVNGILGGILDQENLDTFVERWSSYSVNLIETKIEPNLQKIKQLCESLYKIDNQTTELVKPKTMNLIEWNESNIMKCLAKLNLHTAQPLLGQTFDNQIIFSNLFEIFEQSLPHILDIVMNYKFPSMQMLEYQHGELNKLYSDVLSMERKFHKAEMYAQSEKNHNNSLSIFTTIIPNENIMITPPIRLKSGNLRKDTRNLTRVSFLHFDDVETKLRTICVPSASYISKSVKYMLSPIISTLRNQQEVRYRNIRTEQMTDKTATAGTPLTNISHQNIGRKIPIGYDVLELIESNKKSRQNHSPIRPRNAIEHLVKNSLMLDHRPSSAFREFLNNSKKANKKQLSSSIQSDVSFDETLRLLDNQTQKVLHVSPSGRITRWIEVPKRKTENCEESP